MSRRNSPSVIQTLPLFAIFLVGCDSLLSTSPSPSVTVKPSPHLPGLGLVRSGETFSGKTSWYSVGTNGGTKTASGEKFSDHGDTAAHRTLPFGTLVEVTNLGNGRTVILRITDRGPFKHSRVLDVSIGAAKKLGFDKQGLTTCRVEILLPVEQGLEAESGE